MAGLITNDEFEDRLPRLSADQAVVELKASAWYLYDDLREYRLASEDRPVPAVRSAVARWILFLGTDLEYEYPVSPTLSRLALSLGNLCTLGLLGRAWRHRSRVRYEFWPFFRRSDFEGALQKPALLAGGR
jgi:hypothetical protein